MSRLDETAKGVFVIAATPFTDNGAIDFGSTDRMVDFYLENGATGITVLGMMGEAPKLSSDEAREFVRHVNRRVARRVPVVAGVSSAGFAAMAELSKAAMEDGCAGVMVAPPHNLRTDDQILKYYQQVAQTLGPVPFVLQDFPLVTGVQIATSVINRIIASVPTCVMLKHEDWPGLAKVSALRAESERGGRRISILVGNGGMFLTEEMARGVDGAMTGFAYPEMMASVVAASGAKNLERARDIFDAYLPLMRYEQQPGLGLAVRKYIMAKRGVIASAALREPRVNLSPADIAEIEILIARQERRLKELGA
jgi:4-hydroxy-tetrahydrodipicolinate synthase